jgi:hypothetical protein
MRGDGALGAEGSIIATSEPRQTSGPPKALIMEVVGRETDSFPRDAGSPCRGHT